MADQVKLRRGTSAQMASFTGVADEFAFETDTADVVTHDGATAGGFARHMTFRRQREGVGRYAVAGGTANALTLALSPPLLARPAGTTVAFKAAVNNTGAATLAVDSTGAAALKKATGGALADLEEDDVVANAVYGAVWNGSVWIIAGGVGGRAGGLLPIERQTLSGQSQVDFETSFAAHDNHRFVIEGLRPSQNDVGLACRLKIDGSYQTDSYLWLRTDVVNTATPSQTISASGAVDSTRFHVTTTALRSAAGDSGAAVLEILGVNNADKSAMLEARYTTNSNFLHNGTIAGHYNGSPVSHVVTGVRFVMTAGTLEEGSIAHYAFG